jgi:para-nitrobenzyl esterase
MPPTPHHSVGGDALVSGMALAVDWRIAFKLRWRVPQPAKPWADVLDASAFGCTCMQTDNLPKSEDCLTLNVWQPATASNAPLPVMMWIYGGAPVHGNTRQYPADALAAQGSLSSA